MRVVLITPSMLEEGEVFSQIKKHSLEYYLIDLILLFYVTCYVIVPLNFEARGAI